MQESMQLPTQAELDNPFLKLVSTTDAGVEEVVVETVEEACAHPQPESTEDLQKRHAAEKLCEQAIDRANQIIHAKDALITWAMDLVDLKDSLTETNDRVRELKNEIDESQSSLIEAARHLKQLCDSDLFSPSRKPVDANCEAAPGESQVPPGSDQDESWREYPLKNLSLPDTLRQALAENPGHPILTVGDIQAWTAKGKLLIDIPRVGQAKAEKIEQALEAFWASRKR